MGLGDLDGPESRHGPLYMKHAKGLMNEECGLHFPLLCPACLLECRVTFKPSFHTAAESLGYIP